MGGAIAAALALPAQGATIVDVSVTNSYNYYHGYGTPETRLAGGSYFSDRSPASWLDGSAAANVVQRAELGLTFEGYADPAEGSFYFLHNNYCVGTCGTASRTEIVFEIVNDGSADETLRFDSLITPGHLARTGNSLTGDAGFAFTVTQEWVPTPDETAAGTQRAAEELYSASGRVFGAEMGIVTSNGLAFNGMTAPIEGAGWTVLDWGTTNLNLELGTLAAGRKTILKYTATYYSKTNDSCLDLSNCGGVQVIFGDPRVNGSGSYRMAGPPPPEPPRNAINGGYKSYTNTFSVVDSSTPIPDLSEEMPTLDYAGQFSPRDRVVIAAADPVPESATWAMMLLGFGVVGATIRRRERVEDRRRAAAC